MPETYTARANKHFNAAPLRAVIAHILEVPDRLIMSDWVQKEEPGTTIHDYGLRHPVPSCGTVACAAGWIKELHAPKDTNKDVYISPSTFAMQLLRAEHNDLFHTDEWPSVLRERWENAHSTYERAYIFADVMEDFIKLNLEGQSDYYWEGICDIVYS